MRRPRARITVRGMLVAVAIAAVVIAALLGRRARLLGIASAHRAAADTLQARTADSSGHHPDVTLPQFRASLRAGGGPHRADSDEFRAAVVALWKVYYIETTAEQRRLARLARHERAMQAKYEAAARRPWLPVAADPADPGAEPRSGPEHEAAEALRERERARERKRAEATRAEATARAEALVSEAVALEARGDWPSARRKYDAALERIRGHRGTQAGRDAAEGLVRVDLRLQEMRGRGRAPLKR